MKKTLHWINIIICFLLLGLGIIMVVYGGSGAEADTDTGIFRLMGIVQILMAILVWFIGADVRGIMEKAKAEIISNV